MQLTTKHLNYFIEYLGIIVLILFSKTVPFFIMMTPKVSILMMLCFSIFFTFIYKKNYNNIFNNESFKYMIIFNLMIIINITCINIDIQDNLAYSIIIWGIASYLIICRYTFSRFKHIYLRVLSVLSLISIIIFVLCSFSIISPVQTLRPEGGYYYTYLWHNLGVATKSERLSGIFHEPGAYQIYLIFSIIFYIRELKCNLLNKSDKIFFIPIVIAILLTKSTAAYLILVLLIFFIFKDSYLFKRHKVIMSIMFVCILFFALGSSVVEDKFNRTSNHYESFDIRYNDNVAMLKMTLEKPLFGYGLGTVQWLKRSAELNNITGSNGILFMTSALGVIWFIIYLKYVYLAIKKMKLGIPIIYTLIIFLLLESNEAYIQVAISYLFIVQFAKDNNYKSIVYAKERFN